MRILTLLCLLILTGCTTSRLESLVQALNDRNHAHCLYIHTSFASIGQAYLYARAGNLDCEAIWDQQRRAERP